MPSQASRGSCLQTLFRVQLLMQSGAGSYRLVLTTTKKQAGLSTLRVTEAYGRVTHCPRLSTLIPCHLVLHRAKFHETAAQHIRKQLQLLKAELPLPPENDSNLASMAAAGFGSHVLEDDQDDDGDQSGMYICPLSDSIPTFDCDMQSY